MPSTFIAASAGAVLASRPRRFCSIVEETVIAAVPIAPATRPRPILAARPPSPLAIRGTLRHGAQVAEGLALTELPDDALDKALAVEPAAVRHRGDVPALGLDQLGHRLVDRAGGEQVPRGHRVALADPVAAVLGLIVHRRRPLELEERDVRRAGQRDALRGDARGADDQRRAGRGLAPPDP